MKTELLAALQDPEVVAALKTLATPAPQEPEKLKAALGITELQETITKLSQATVEAQKAAEKAERDALIAEASRDGKVIPLSNETVAALSVPALREMITKLPKGVVTTKREVTLSIPSEADKRATFLSEKKAEGAAELGAFIKRQMTPSVN